MSVPASAISNPEHLSGDLPVIKEGRVNKGLYDVHGCETEENTEKSVPDFGLEKAFF